MEEIKSGTDRVWFSFAAKINIGNYESKDISLGMASDVLPDETVDDAFGRIQELVVAEIDQLIPILRSDGTLGEHR